MKHNTLLSFYWRFLLSIQFNHSFQWGSKSFISHNGTYSFTINWSIEIILNSPLQNTDNTCEKIGNIIFWWAIKSLAQTEIFCKRNGSLVFCFQNCSDLFEMRLPSRPSKLFSAIIFSNSSIAAVMALLQSGPFLPKAS